MTHTRIDGPWIRRLAVAAVALALAGGFVGIGWRAPEPTEARPVAASEAPVPTTPPRREHLDRVKRAPPEIPEAEGSRILNTNREDGTVRLEEMYEQFSYNLPDGPPKWLEGPIPELYWTDYERTMRDIVEQCGKEQDFVGVECSEPPCVAVFRGQTGDEANMSFCQPYLDTIGGASSVKWGVECPGGRTEIVILLIPDSAEAYLDVRHPGDLMYRATIRGERVDEAWRCQPAGN